jgi:predicted patatin/cPLA2 family phospholipase
MAKDIILIIEGGAMSGIFSAGVINSFEQKNIYSRIDCIYCVSAGAHIAAYFLSQKSPEGTTIYTDSLLLLSKRQKFIDLNIFKIISKLWNLFFFKENMHLMDLEVLKEIEKTKHKIDPKKIKNSKIKFYVKIFDFKNLKTKYIDGKKNTIEAINISSNMPPYMYIKTRHTDYYDGSTVPNDSFLDIVKQNENKKIIWILNEKRTIFRKIKDIPFRLFDLLLKTVYLGLDYMTYHIIHFFDTPTIERLKLYNNVYVVYPNSNVRKFTKNKKKLLKLYYDGVKKGAKALNKLNIKFKI